MLAQLQWRGVTTLLGVVPPVDWRTCRALQDVYLEFIIEIKDMTNDNILLIVLVVQYNTVNNEYLL